MATDRKHEKRHANAWDAPLSDEQRDLVFRKATQGGFSWEAVAAWINKEFCIPAPTRTAFYTFLSWWRPQYVARRVQERVLARDALREERKQVGDMSPELAQSLEDQASVMIAAGDLQAGQIIFGMAAKVREDMRKTFDLATRREDLALRKQDMTIKLRRLELLETKLHEAQDAGATVDPKALADEVDRILGRKS
jgi:hypothetical protein